MRKFYSHVSAIRFAKLLSAIIVIVSFASNWALAQVATYTQEVFNTNIPFSSLPDRRVNTTDWVQGKVLGGNTAPNDFEWVNSGLNPAAANQNIVGFPAGAGFVRYVNRTVPYAAVSGAANGEAAYLATRSLDFSGHTTYNAAADTFGISVWRDGTTGALLTVMDYIEVYINTQPNTVGATLLSDRVNGSNKIYRSSSQLPAGSTANAWNRYQYVVPNLPSYVSGTGGNSNVYIIIIGYSAGGNNIFLDNFNFPQWTTPMKITNATLIYQENADVGKSTTSNLLLGVKITTKGSTSALKLDGAAFSTAGSTNFANDAQNLAAYFTGGSANFSTSAPNGVINMPTNGTLPPGAVGVSGFGWYGGACPSGTTPATMTLNPGDENYIWLAVDIKPTAQAGNYVGGDFQFIIADSLSTATGLSSATCRYYGATFSTTANLTTTPIPPQTSGLARQIDQAYAIPTYSAGCSYSGYNQNDYCSAVDFFGDNGSRILNYDHDGNPATYCPSCLATAANQPHCIRLGCHPPDYTQFKVNGTVNPTYQKRTVQVTVGYGIRGAGPSYTLKAQAGEWPYNSNNIAVFIDWNKDGDFSDSYNGTGGLITEAYGTHTMLNGDLNSYPIAAWPANTTWTINVPDKSDVVTNVGGSGGGIFLGNVRMRVREVYASTNIDPFASYTWGEVEDYTIQVLDNCPTPSTSVCKWIGNTSDWNTASNWCPAKPTINDMAYIPVVSAPFVAPTIQSNTTATCRILKIENGAVLNIDAPTNSKLIVADDVIIGATPPAGGSTSAINVSSNYSPTATIPGKSLAPPAGTALSPQTPFRSTAYQQKTQVSYSAYELSTTFGWKAGDVIDSISIEVSSITVGVGASTYPNFRIQAFLISGAQVWFPFPAAPSTKVAVMAGDANVVAGWPRTIYGGTGLPSGTNLTLNMPNATGGTKANGNYYTFVLNQGANALVYDGVSNLVLSFETNTTAGSAPVKNYVLYDETDPHFTTLSLSYNGGVQATQTLNTGYNLIGNSYYKNTGTGVNTTLAGITATVSNQRPRLDFSWHRPYSRFDIVVGGNWYNNNRNVQAPSTVAGSSGFVAGYSKVIFDPVAALRSTVTTPIPPGLSASFNSWNPSPGYPTTLAALLDIDQNISSQVIGGASSTVFNQLEINKASASGKAVIQNSTAVSTIGAYADSLYLNQGELKLNHKEFTLQNPSAAYLVRNTGWLKSEDNGAPSPGTIDSKFTWKIGAGTTGTYSIPFKGATTSVFNVKYNKTTGAEDVGNLTVGTYGTIATNNTPYTFPALASGNPLRVLYMNTNPSPIVDATPWTVDRFWYIAKSSGAPLSTGTLTFEYDNSVEGTLTSAYTAGEMRAQRYELTGASPGWHAPYAGQSDAIGVGSIRLVNHPAAQIDNTYSIWAITHINGSQAPLPLQLVKFDAKQVDNKVKVWWDVQSEADVAKYAVERTVDQNFFDLVANKAPQGPSTNLLSYDAWDNKPLKGLQYYRLATQMNDGSISYSNLVPVRFGINGAFQITNIVTNTDATIKVDFSYNSKLPYSFMIADLMGNIVAKGDNHNAVEGENSIVIPANLAHGIYTITLINSETAVTEKLFY